jgi:chlorite dismutase
MSTAVDSQAPGTQAAPQEEKKHGNMPMNMVTSYVFYRIDPSFRLLPEAQRREAIDAFNNVVAQHQEKFWIRSYSTFGLREDADFFFWNIAKEVEPIQEFATALYRTPLGAYLRQTHNFIAVSKESEYTKDHEHPPLNLREEEAKYLFVYPFVKTRAWYLLPFPERMRIMKEHIDVGHDFPDVTINTAYSFGIDDQDFVVAFDGNSLEEFVKLVMKLRETESSRYTERDNPMFIGLKKPMNEVLDTLGLV